jgi:hypothetical protein
MQSKGTGGKGFDGYRKPKGTRGCVVCSEPVVGRVVVVLQERREDPDKGTKDANRFSFPAIDSTSRSFCEAHAIEVYEAAKKALPER